MANKKITYGIDFNVDNSNLQKVRNELNEISKLGKYAIKVDVEGSNLDTLKQSAKELQNAFENAFNPRLNTINIEKFNQSLKNLDIKRIEADFSQLGTKGAAAFRNMTSEILTTQREVRKTSNFIDSMATTLGNTIKWSIASSAINTVTGKIQEAWGYTKKLDQSLNDIRIVTEKSADSMEKFAKSANKTAKNLGTATTNYTKAALIYYQQGLGEQDVQARTQVTVKAANVTGQSASEVSEQLTAVWNGYKVVAEEAELYVDKLAAVAASTAADLEELSTGMSKVASAASTMGVDIDQLSAQLSTIVSVTRQDASLVGTALKTIYARMGDLKVNGVDEFGTSLGDVSGQLKQMGIDVLDQQGNLRDMGSVIEEVAAKWGTWTDAQQQAAAVAIAGKRQYNNLIALFENWDMYESALSTSQNSAGTLQKQQEIYMDSLEARLQRLSTAGEKVFDELIDSESTKELIDSITWIVDKLGNFVSAMGGAGNMLLTFGGIATTLFQKQIAGGISHSIDNIRIFKNNIKASQAELELMVKYEGASDEAIKEMVTLKEHELHNEKLLTAEQKAQYDYYLKMTAEIYNQIDAQKQANQNAADYFNTIFQGSQYIQGTKDAGTILKTEQAISKEDAVKALKEAYVTNNIIKDDLADTKSVEKAQKSYKGYIDNPNDKRRNPEKAVENFEKARADTQDLLTQAISSAGLSEKSIERINALLEESKKENADLLKIRSQAVQVMQQENVVMEKHIKTLEEGTEAVENLEQKHKDLKTSITDFMKGIDFTALMTGITNAVGGMMTAIGAAKALVNAFKALGDESLSTAEKIEQVLMGIGTFIASAVPSVLSSVNAIVTANKVGGSAAQKAWGWIGLILTAITTVMMIVVELVKLIPKQKSALEKAKETTKALNNEANELKESLKETREEYLNLIDAISDYDSAQAAIDKLRAGTDEWKEAILRANLEAQQLAETYEGLKLIKEDSKYGVDIFSIDPESWSDALKAAQEKINDLSMQEGIAENAATNALYKEKQEELAANPALRFFVTASTGTYKTEDKELGAAVWQGLLGDVQDIDLEEKKTEYLHGESIETDKFSEEDRAQIADSLIYSKYFNTTAENVTSKEYLHEYFDELSQLTDEQLKQELDTLNLIARGEGRTAELTQENLDTLIDTYGEVQAIQAKLPDAEDKVTDEYARQNSYNEGVYSFFAKEGSTKLEGKGGKGVDIDDIDNDFIDYDLINEMVIYDYNKETGKVESKARYDIGGKIQEGDVDDVEEGFKHYAKEAFGENADINIEDNVLGWETADLGKAKIKVNGQEYTYSEITNKVKQKWIEENLGVENKELEDKLTEYKKSGQLQETLYFEEGYYDKKGYLQWEDATLAKYQNIIDKSQDQTQENAKEQRDEFIAALRSDFGESSGVDLDEDDLSKFSNLTGQQIKDVAYANQMADVYGAEGAVAEIINDVKDPAQMEKVASLLKNVNWADSDSVTKLQAEMFEIGIDIEDESWTKFFDKVNSGTKEWIANSEKVAEKLDYIKNTISNIKMGDIISDEDYKKIISLDPTKAKNFIKTASGWQALASGSQIAQGMTQRYNNLKDIKAGYQATKTAATTLSKSGVSAGDMKALSEKDDIVSFLKLHKDELDSMANAMGVPIPYGKFEKAATELEKATENADISRIKTQIQNALDQIDQALIDNAEGLFNEDKAEEIWATSIATSREEVERARNEGRISEATYNKSMQSYKNTYLTELGFTEDIFNSLGAADLEEHLKNIRKLELDYFKDIDKELDKIGKKIELAFGKEKIGLIEDNINLLKEKQRLENERYDLAQTSWDTMAESALSNLYNNYGISSFEITTNGQIDNQKVLNILSESNDENLKTNLNSLLDIWDKIEESANSAQEAMYEVLDLQIEAFSLQRDMQKEFIDSSLEQMKRLSEAWLGKNMSDIFGEKTFAAQMQLISDGINRTTASFDYSFAKLNNLSKLSEDKLTAINKENFFAARRAQDMLTAYRGQQDYYGYTDMTHKDFKTIMDEEGLNEAVFNWWEGADWERLAESAQKSGRDPIELALDWLQVGAVDVNKEYARIQQEYGVSKEELDAAIIAAIERGYSSSILNDSETSKEVTQYIEDNYGNKYFDGIQSEKTETQFSSRMGSYFLEDSWSESFKKQAFNGDLNKIKEYLGGVFSIEEWARVSQAADALGWMGYTGSDEEKMQKILSDLGMSTKIYGADWYTLEKIINDFIIAAHEIVETDFLNIINSFEDPNKDNPYATTDEEGNTIFDTAAFVEDYKESFDEAYAQLDELKAQVTEYYELYSAGQEELMALYDEEIEKLSSLNSNYSNLLNLRKLINSENRDNSASLLSAMVNNSQIAYELSIEKMEDAQNELTRLEDLEKVAPGSVTEEMWKIARENLQSATLAVNDAAEGWMEAISNQFRENLHLIINDFIEEAGGANLDVLSQAWELEKKQDEKYLDDVNEAYALSEMERNFQKSIDETDNISAQNKLMQKRLEIEEELTRAKERQGKLSQYDIDRANAMYDITLKQIALEEAQQTSNKMKLTRDAMGNYTYQYVQDENAIAEAEAELAAAQNDLYNMDKDRKKELIDEWFSLMSEYEEKMAEAMKTGNVDLQNQIQEAYWGEKGFLSVLRENLALLEDDSNWLNDLFSDTAEKIVKIKISDENGDDIGDSVQGLLSSSQTLISTFSNMVSSNIESVTSAVQKISENVTQNAQDVADSAADIQANIGTLLTNLSSYVSKIAELEDDLKPYDAEYKSLLGDQITVTEDSTQATKNLTQVVLRIADQLDNDNIDNEVTVGNQTYKVRTADGLYAIVAEEDI